MQSRRRLLSAAGAALMLAGCGFQLRQPPSFVFDTIFVGASPASAVGNELKHTLATSSPVKLAPAADAAQVILDLLDERREKVVVGLNATGQVREFQIRTRIRFRLRTPSGKELIAPTELLQQRDISFNESVALAKEVEENLLYRDMQTDLVQQLMRRLAAVKAI